ncbi:TetR/AcrR family transcriptional regulator [Nocardia callitridis]|uniref:TetR/AcrR family transcriptional regulator n=1 Tax=Nocardia callitridis TaxID=648753 RepID=A0ABP9JTB6_9NOCA
MTTPRRRADAVDNRDRIIKAARAALANSDELRLNAVAKAAGVGQGTLYRHFPTREDLLAEVYRRDVDALVDAAATLAAEHDPLTALARWFDRIADYARVKRGVLSAVDAGVWQGLSADSHGPIGDAMTALLDAGKAEGTLRADADARDVMLLMTGLTRLTAAEWEPRAGRLLDILLDGLRTKP